MIEKVTEMATPYPVTFVPYSDLERSPVTLRFGRVAVHLVLDTPSTCLVSVPPRFRITDSDSPGAHMSVVVSLGTSFIISFNGGESEVRLGRRIIVRDVNTYTSTAHLRGADSEVHTLACREFP